MGDIAEDIENGLCCCQCGAWMSDLFDKNGKPIQKKFDNPPGHPRKCPDCKKKTKSKRRKK